VIYIERTFRNREMGVIGDPDPDTYDAVVLSGLVVRTAEAPDAPPADSRSTAPR
jgi:hypothetical protein